MNIGGYNFSEPKRVGATDSIERAAVYVVMTHDSKSWFYLYVGQTKDVAERFDKHEKWNCWLRNQKTGGFYVAILLMADKERRLEIETDLIEGLPDLPCNKE